MSEITQLIREDEPTIDLTQNEMLESIREYFELPEDQQPRKGDMTVSMIAEHYDCGKEAARSKMQMIAENEPDKWRLLKHVLIRGTEYWVLRAVKQLT